METDRSAYVDRAVYILAAKRTPFGKFWSGVKDISAPRLGATVIRRIIGETGVAPEAVDAVYMGQVLTAGAGQNPARQAALYGGLPNTCDARTFGKVCSSSLAAMDHAVDKILLGKANFVFAGGMESMSKAPYLVWRPGRDFGDKLYSFLYPKSDLILTDSMIFDGLCDTYTNAHMGQLADMCANAYGILRETQEAYAVESHLRALEAHKHRWLDSQIVAVEVGDVEMSEDEGVRIPDPEKIKKMSPVFTPDGTVTAATSSQISDGAAVLLLSDRTTAEKFGVRTLARIVAFAVHSQEPEWYTTAPVGAIRKVLRIAGLRLEDIDLFEINEAFAVVPLYAMRELHIPHEKVNVWGGAIAIGHPIGASGARITANLVHQLMHTNGRYGIAVVCNGGGEAMAVLIESTLTFEV